MCRWITVCYVAEVGGQGRGVVWCRCYGAVKAWCGVAWRGVVWCGVVWCVLVFVVKVFDKKQSAIFHESQGTQPKLERKRDVSVGVCWYVVWCVAVVCCIVDCLLLCGHLVGCVSFIVNALAVVSCTTKNNTASPLQFFDYCKNISVRKVTGK